MLWACNCLSVRHKSEYLITWLNIRSNNAKHSPKDYSFLMPKISAKYYQLHPSGGAKCRWGGLKIGDFRQITRYILEMVQDRCMIPIDFEQEVVCTLSNGDVADDLEWPVTTPSHPIVTFCTPYHILAADVNNRLQIRYVGWPNICGTDKASDFRFCTRIVHVKY